MFWMLGDFIDLKKAANTTNITLLGSRHLHVSEGFCKEDIEHVERMNHLSTHQSIMHKIYR